MTDVLQSEWEIIRKRWHNAWTRGDRSETTWHNYALDVRSYLEWCAEEGVNSVTLDAADDYVAHRERTSKNAGRNAARAIKALGKFLPDYDEDMTDPYRRLQVPQPPAPTKTPTATQEDLESLLGTCDKTWQGLRDRAIILTLAGTGMRRSEVANMAPSDFDPVSQMLKIPKTKTRKPHDIWLPDVVVDAVMKYLRAKQPPEGVLWVSSTDSRPLTATGIGQMLKRRENIVGISLGAHAWRRKHAGDWLSQQGSETGLMARCGWSDTRMVARYAKDVADKNSNAEAQRLMQ